MIRRVAGAAALLAAIATLSAPAGVQLVDADGVPYKWDLATEQPNVVGGKVTFFPHPASLRDQVSGQSTPLAAIRLGVREWEIGTTSIAFLEDTSRAASGPNGGDRVNWIGWVQSGLDPFTLAITTVTRDESVITDMDVALNDRDWTWDTFTPGRPGLADIEALVTHEWGHAIGCDHVPLRTSTMYAFTEPGMIALRTIAPDDRALIGSIYPNAAFAATTGSITGVVDVAGLANDRAVHVVAVSVVSGEPEASTLTRPDGTWRIDGLAAGVYRIVAAPCLPLTGSMNKFWTSGSTSFLPSVLTEDGANPGRILPLAVTAGHTVAAPRMTVAFPTNPFEPNGSAATATHLEIGDAVTARLENGGDEDWYSFDGTAGKEITVNVLSWGIGSDANPSLRIVSPTQGSVLLQDDARPPQIHLAQIEGQDLDVRVMGFALPETGMLQLRLRNETGGGNGNGFYALFLTPSSDTPSSALTLVTADPSRLDADGVSSTTVVVRPRRETGADVGAGATVSLVHSGTGALGAVTDRGDGTYTAPLTAPATPGRDRFTVMVTTAQGTATILDALTVVYLGPADAARSTLTVEPRRIAAGSAPAQATALLVPRDAAGEALGAGRTVEFGLTAPAGAHLQGVVDLGDGSYGDTILGPAAAGEGTVTAKVDGAPLGASARIAFGFALADVLTDAVADVQAFLATDGLSSKAGKLFAKAEHDAAGALSELTDGGPKAERHAVAAAKLVIPNVVLGLAKAGVPLVDPGTGRDLALAIREAAARAVATAVADSRREQRKIDSANARIAEGDAALTAGDEAKAAAKWKTAYDGVRSLQPQ